jgi:hypothetical protein
MCRSALLPNISPKQNVAGEGKETCCYRAARRFESVIDNVAFELSRWQEVC